MRTSLNSTLPTFEKGDVYETEIGQDGPGVHVIELTCKRTHCDRTFIVPIKDYWRKSKFDKVKPFTRSCPFCFGTSKVPKKPKI